MLSQLHDPHLRAFASDNYAGVHPELLAAIAVANGGHQTAYGEDVYTGRLQDVVRAHFGPTAEAHPVLTGTGANIVALQAMTPRWGAVLCAATSHLHTDEGVAPEAAARTKLIVVDSRDGKLTPEHIAAHASALGDEHRAQPSVVSITQATEPGTVYTPQETAAVSAAAHANGMTVHLDGARLANAAAALDVPLRALTTDAGVDVVTLGGTKNGMLFGEAVVVLDPAAVDGLAFVRKTSAQLASKMRFVSAQFIELLGSDLWLRNARHANAMAGLLAERVRRLPGVEIVRPVQANAVFAVLPREVTTRLQKRFNFYTRDERTGEVRWMCSFDTTPDDVETFVRAIAEELGVQGSDHEGGQQ
ncbi:beta-eliminating lyase-related protein [Kitasatospora sp. MAP5-34]|uniref:threonine aldolase family protein n=1 Tax=Kitasatospora sp. MAP5-34 TaxID=3035102 RepID=UPI002476F070|nr:beta-eliminating lyase-related protein [Kitasatospora sp. MAP5-34]MDH6577392.1 threonine aldolase [Kitasatospora sp. MAP5-34]